MKTLAFLSQKGGSGKTTLVVHTAVAAQEAGLRVMLVDTDPQRSATAWRDTRTRGTGSTPTLATVPATGLGRIIESARGEGIDLLMVDTSPRANPEAALVARQADLVLIPVRPAAFDVAAIKPTVVIVKAAQVSATFVLSACPFRAPEIAEARAALVAHGLPVAPAMITDRRAFSRAVATGRAVTEFDSKGRAAEEIRALWAWVKEAIYDDNDRAGSIHRDRAAAPSTAQARAGARGPVEHAVDAH